MSRKSIPKSVRCTVYKKYGGRCAYCGRKIEYKDMQIDHFKPLNAWNVDDCGDNSIENLMPACRACNHYKRAHTIEIFRKYIQEIPQKLRANYIYKIGVMYGNVIENEKPIVFHFEKEASK